jgi:hypothetical protein
MTNKQKNLANEKETVHAGLVLFSKIIAAEIFKDRFSTTKANLPRVSKEVT